MLIIKKMNFTERECNIHFRRDMLHRELKISCEYISNFTGVSKYIPSKNEKRHKIIKALNIKGFKVYDSKTNKEVKIERFI